MKRSIDASAARFLVAGALNTGVTYLVYLALIGALGYRYAYTAAFVIGILVSYLLNALFVFRRRIAARTFFRFPLVYVAQYAAGLALVALFVETMGIAAWLAPLLALVVTIPLTYWLSRVVFAPGEKT